MIIKPEELKIVYEKEDDGRIRPVYFIDAEPVRHGRWEMKPDPYGFFGEIPVCSECGCTTKMRDKTKFCPHCGVRMVEDEAD